MKLKKILLDFGYVIFSNVLVLMVSTIVILVVPKLVGVKEFGYWQLFTFFSSYLGLLPLGWLDGIYLRYGGEKYSDLDKNKFFSQFVMLMILQLFFAVLIVISGLFMENSHYAFIAFSLAGYLIVYIAQSFFKFVLQLTNRVREYSVITLISSLLYVISIILLLLLGYRKFELLIGAFIFGNTVAMFYGGFLIKDIFISGINNFHWTWSEMRLNIKVGSQLLIANVASLLIIGVVRIGIQNGWGIETFGKISLTLQISNLLMVFIGAISLVLFPKLRRVERDKMNEIYPILRDTLMPAIFIGILVYFPISYLIPLWLPKYNSALIYMSVLFPMVAYQAKFEILSNTFLKVLRMERQLLFINVITLLISVILTIVSVFTLHNLTMTVFTIIIVMAIRSTIAELYLKSKLKIKFSVEMLIETVMIIAFIALAWYLSVFGAFIGYIVILIVYLIIKKKDILQAVRAMKKI
ncbi:lipopolysaccharide biosynthesis protein [Dellaglioa sp. L3N]